MNLIPVGAQEAGQAETDDARQVQALIERVSIKTPAELETAVHWTKEIKAKSKELDEKRKSFLEPLREATTRINEFFKPAIEALDAAEATIKERIVGFIEDRGLAQDKLLAEVETSANREALLTHVAALEVPKIKGLSIRSNWTGEVTDEAALLQWAVENKRTEFLQINVKALQAVGKAFAIPGWRAFQKRIVAIGK